MCNENQNSKATPFGRALERMSAGDANAYEVVYESCDDSLRAFISMCYGWFGSDFVEEVAIRTHEYAFTHIDKYDSDKGASFQTWLNWQARNIAAQVMAERCVRDYTRDGQSSTSAGPEAELRNGILREEWTALPDDERLVILYHDLEGLTFTETAQATGLTMKQVRYKRDKGLAEMKRRLLARGVQPVDVDTTPVPVYYGWDHTEPDDEYTTSVPAILPDGPDTLVGAAAHDLPEDEVEE